MTRNGIKSFTAALERLLLRSLETDRSQVLMELEELELKIVVKQKMLEQIPRRQQILEV